VKKKLTVNSLAMGNLRHRKKQYTLLIISILLAMTFVSGIPFFVSCLSSSQQELQFRRYGKQDLIFINAHEEYFYDTVYPLKEDLEIGYSQIISYIYPENGDSEKGIYVGCLDEKAEELYYQTLLEGRFPEKENEIAVEKTALLMLGDNIIPGDSLTFSETSFNSDGTQSENKHTYTVTGILDDKKLYLENLHSGAFDRAQTIPSAFIATAKETDNIKSDRLIAFVKEKENTDNFEYLAFLAAPGYPLDTTGTYVSSIGDSYRNIMTSMGTLAFLSFLFASLSCFAIINAFNTMLKSRQNQIGLLKAVGATKRQIMNIFAREALLISLFCTPISILTAYSLTKLSAHLLGENFIFIPDIKILFLGALFSLICVLLSALLPLIKAANLSPLQAIRDIETLRKVRSKKIKSQTDFNVIKLTAKRKLIFAGKKRIIVSMLISLSVLICSLAGSVIKISAHEAQIQYNSDYIIEDWDANDDHSYSKNAFVNENADYLITETERQMCFNIPQVESVTGTKTCRANILIEDELPLYLKINNLSLLYRGIKYTEEHHILNEIISENEEYYKTNDKTAELFELISKSPENIVNPLYTQVQEKAVYTQDIFNTIMMAKSDKLIKELESNLIAGKINTDKLNSGEEIIIRAPEEIGYSLSLYGDMQGYMYSFNNMEYENSYENSNDEKESYKNIVLRGKNPFKVGDSLTVSVLTEENGVYKRTDRTFKIGAIVGTGRNIDNRFALITTLRGLDNFGIMRPYAELGIDLKEECDADTDSFVTSRLQAIFPGASISSSFLINETERADHRTLILILTALVLVFMAVCISLISNTVTSNIRESKRTIGTLRAVGCSERSLNALYSLQIIEMTVKGLITGFAFYVISCFAMNQWIMTDTHLPFSILPMVILIILLLAICHINLIIKVRNVTNVSIVDNIREL